MNVGAVNAAYGNVSTQATQPTQRAQDTQAVRDRDGDNDNNPNSGVAGGVNSTPSPTVNTEGQKIGQVINVKA